MAGQIVFWALVGVLAVYGLCELLMRLCARLLLPRELETRTLILLKGRRRDLPELQSPTARRLWQSRGMGDVILVDAGLDTDSRLLADRLAEPEGHSAVLAADELKEALKI